MVAGSGSDFGSDSDSGFDSDSVRDSVAGVDLRMPQSYLMTEIGHVGKAVSLVWTFAEVRWVAWEWDHVAVSSPRRTYLRRLNAAGIHRSPCLVVSVVGAVRVVSSA